MEKDQLERVLFVKKAILIAKDAEAAKKSIIGDNQQVEKIRLNFMKPVSMKILYRI